MQIKSKFLSDAAWKDLVAKNKLKDNGLQKALEKLKRVGEDEFDEQTKILDEITKLAGQMKKDKAAAPAAKHLGQLQDDADALSRDVAKAKAENEKAAKAKAEAEKKTAAKGKESEEEEEESSALLTTQLKPLLRAVMNNGATMEALLGKAGKRVVVMLSRRTISPSRKKIIADELGSAGGIKYYFGTCALEAGTVTFTLQSEVTGMAKLVRLALLEQTGLRVSKVRCRGEDGEDGDEHEEGEAPGGAPAQKAEAGHQAVPPGPDVAALGGLRAEWGKACEHALGELGRLKSILQHEYRDVADQQEALAAALKKVDATIGSIDDELTRQLDEVLKAPPAARAAAAASARQVLARVRHVVDSDPLLGSIDGNELAPDMHLTEPLRARLKDIEATLA